MEAVRLTNNRPNATFLPLRKRRTKSSNGAPPLRVTVPLALISKGSILLEIGCGDGGFLCRGSREFELSIGIDIAEFRLRKARLQCPNDAVDFLMADMNSKLPLKNASVSCVAIIATFEYAHSPFNLLMEVSRILEKGGNLIIQVANLVWAPRRLRLLAGRIPPTGSKQLINGEVWNGGYLHSFSLPDIKELLNRCGFQIVRVESASRIRRLATIWPSLLSPDLLLLCKKV